MTNPPNLSEEEIKKLFIAHYGRFVAFARKFVPLEMAEDLVQDVFLQLLKKNGTLNISANLEGYIYKAIKNKYIDYTKSRNVQSKYIDNIMLSTKELEYYDPAKHVSLTLDEHENALFFAIENLPPKCREIIKSKYFLGKKPHQMSEELGISLRTVETHVYTGIKHLKKALKFITVTSHPKKV